MATISGLVYGVVTLTEYENNLVNLGDKTTMPVRGIIGNDTEYPGAVSAATGYIDLGRTKNALLYFSYGDDILFYKIWFEPFFIDAGFIVEDVDYDIKIWNAFFDTTASITAVNGSGTDGTEITHDSLPITIGKFADEWITVTVLQEGPPLQETSYTITVNAADYITEIEGIRVVPVPWDADWDSKVNIEIHFETALSRNKWFMEQRRPLRYKQFYKISYRVSAEGVSAQKLKQTMAYAHDKVVGVPVFSEHAYPSQDFSSSTTINTSNDLSTNWYLNNQAQYIVITDHDSLQTEIKEIDSVNANSIVCTLPVSGSFTWQNCVVYPVVMCTADSLRIRPETDLIFVGDFVFTEYERASAT